MKIYLENPGLKKAILTSQTFVHDNKHGEFLRYVTFPELV